MWRVIIIKLANKSTSTLPVKSFGSLSLNEFTSEVKSSPASVSEPARHANSLKGHVSASDKLSQVNVPLNSGTDVLQSQQIAALQSPGVDLLFVKMVAIAVTIQ